MIVSSASDVGIVAIIMLDALFIALSFLMLFSPVLLDVAVVLVAHTVVDMARRRKPRATMLWRHGRVRCDGDVRIRAMVGQFFRLCQSPGS